MMKNRKVLFGIVFSVIVITSFFLNRLCIFIESDAGIVHCLTTATGEQISLKYIHSVQLTPVYENFVVVGPNDLLLYSTQYSSYGVGLPSLPSDGVFTQNEHGFDLKLQRHFPVVKVRCGPEAKLTILYQGKVLPIYQELSHGSLVRIRVGKYYTRWI